ncbi:uncharacterized protein LOC122961481 [Acropora millepora]|uniref:uncharacterized protein LOC122961481 n=1 Tax=Acropora millepora TaxID=45264 RepID=UPI001CF3DBEC|nr:uncharacterized protein LOC122961481 [Acropora millepora]
MPSYQYPRSLVAQFPEDVYRNAGASDVLPLVMKNLDADKILAVQFLRAGRVRLTFQDSDTCSQVLKDGLDFGDFSVDLLPADDRLRTVHLRDLPVEIEEEVVFSFLGGYGEVLSVSHCFFDEYPNVRNGNRVAKVLLDRDIPQFTEIDGCNCRIWYPRQPPQCSVCRELGHRAPACPLSGRCRRCHQPGHMARECTQAWGPPLSVSRTDHSMDVEEDSGASSSDSEVPSTTASVALPAVTSPPVMSTSPVTAVCSTVAAPTSRPTVAVTTPANVSTVTMTTAASVPSASVKVSTASAAESSNSDASTASVPRPKKPRTVASGRIFRQRLANHYTSVELPSFDNVTGKEWDSRARAYVRQQVRIIFEDKRMGLTKRDFVSWKIEDLGALSIDICKVLSIKNYLTEFVFDIIKGYWSNDRIALGET